MHDENTKAVYVGLAMYARERGYTIVEQGLQAVVVDHLADLYHLCQHNQIDFTEALAKAMAHLAEEGAPVPELPQLTLVAEVKGGCLNAVHGNAPAGILVDFRLRDYDNEPDEESAELDALLPLLKTQYF